MAELGFGLAFTLTDNFSQSAQRIQGSMKGLQGNFDKLAMATAKAQVIGGAIGNIQSALDLFVSTGANFDAQVKDLSAITGVTGAALDDLAGRARQLAKDFGLDASASVESFKVILSRLGPELAQTPEALTVMSTNVALLSKTMRNDAVGSVDALTTAMLQYNVDISDAAAASATMTLQMDMMTKAALVGSAEVPQIAAALKVAGGAAYNAGVNFDEFNAAVQVLGKSALYGSEAGTALRNVLGRLGEGEFLDKRKLAILQGAGVNMSVLTDKSLSLAQRLGELRKIMGNTAAVGEVFGLENQRAAMALLNNTDLLKKWTVEIKDSQGATQAYADTVMSSFSEMMARGQAWAKDIAISIFDATKPFLPFIQGALMAGQALVTLMPVMSMAITGLAGFATAAWAAIAPFLPFIAIGAAVVATFVAIYEGISYATESFAKFMATGERATGFMGVVQRIGGLITGIITLFKTATDEGFTMSLKMEQAFGNLGILNIITSIGTAIVRLKAFFGGLFQGISEGFAPLMEGFSVLATAFEPIGELFTKVFTGAFNLLDKLGLGMGKFSGQVSPIREFGRAIGRFITMPFQIAGWALTAFATILRGVIAVATKVTEAFYSFGYAVANSFLTAYQAGKNMWDWFLSIPDLFVNWGANFVNSIMTGITNAWGGLKSLLAQLISTLPGGELLLSALGADKGYNKPLQSTSLAIKQSAPMLPNSETQAIMQANAANKAVAATPLVIDKSTITEIQRNTKITVELDGENIAKKVNERNELADARR